MQPKCTLIRYDMLKFSFETSNAADAPKNLRQKQGSAKTTIHGEFAANKEDASVYMVKLFVQYAACMEIVQAGNTPMVGTFDTKIQGVFKWAEALTPENFALPYLNAAQILYGALRDRIAQFSATSYFGPLFLPTVMLQDFLFPKIAPTPTRANRRATKG